MSNALAAITAEEFQQILAEIADRNNTEHPKTFLEVARRFFAYYGEQLEVSQHTGSYYAEQGGALLLKAYWAGDAKAITASAESLNEWVMEQVVDRYERLIAYGREGHLVKKSSRFI